MTSSFEVACRCGRLLRGARLRTHQVRRCEQCGGAVFILPRSPLPPPRSAPAAAPVLTRRRRRWLVPVVALGLALAAAWWFWPPPGPPPLDKADLARQLTDAHRHLDAGSFRQAAEQLGSLRSTIQARPGLLPAQDVQELFRLERQAAALADLSTDTLEAMLAHAAAAAEAEWLAEFPHRYQGKAVLLDVEVRSAGGQLRHDYLLWAGDEVAALDLNELALLRQLPLDSPRRVVFLARLASVRREPGRGWVVRLQADSGVLVTEAGAARVACPALGGAEFDAVLARQRIWAAGPTK